MRIGLVVEGHGDVAAMPVFIRKISQDLGFIDYIEIPRPFRLSRGKMVKKNELLRAVTAMSVRTGNTECGAVLVVFDADDDCPVEIATEVQAWLDEAAVFGAVVVVANREFEAWLIASAVTLRGLRGLPENLAPPPDPDAIRDAKGWLGRNMPNGYSETLDQPALAASASAELCSVSRSFRKFSKVLEQILDYE